MSRSRRLSLLALAALLMALPGAAALPAGLSLDDLEGLPVQLTELTEGRVSVIVLVSACCAAGQKLLSDLDEFQKELAPTGVLVVVVSQDQPRHFARTRAWLKARNPGFTVLQDPELNLSRVVNPGGDQPFTLLLDQQGATVYSKTHYRSGELTVLKEKVLELIEASKATPES